MNPCPSRSEMKALLADRLAGDAEQAILTHVEECRRCRQILEELTVLEGRPSEKALPHPGQELTPSWSWPARPNDPGISSPRPGENKLTRLPPTPDTPHGVPPGAEAPEPFPQVPAYKILGVLGRGGMGVVYKARHVPLDRLVALKMILAGDESDPGLRERFQAEARAVAQLSHPNIVQIYEVGEHGGLPFFSLELVEGGSLAKKLTGQPWPAGKAAALVAALAGAVQHAHDQGVLHRDLKPGNVLLTEDGVPKVTDFGLAKILGRAEPLTEPGAIMGTPAYMAPEQASSAGGAVGPASDVFALGAILYELLTGKPLYQGTTWELLQQASSGQVTPLHQHNRRVPAALNRICRKALAKEPARRYGTAAELKRDLERFLDRPRRLRRAFLGGGVGLLVAAAGGTLLIRLLGGDEEKQPALPADRKEKKPALLDDRLVLRVWSRDKVKRGWRIGENPGALPVRPGDRIRFEVRLNQPAYLYLLFLDAQGGVIPLYPWHRDTRNLDKTLDDPPPLVPPRSELVWPGGDNYMELDDQGGLETILLLARNEPIRDPKLLARLMGPLPWPPTPLGEEDEFAVRGGSRGQGEESVRFDHHRGIKKRLEQIDEPLEQLLERLRGKFELLRAVRFAHKGR